MTAPIVLTLPWPPGVNNLFATVKSGKVQRRIPTRRYKAWLYDAAAALAAQPAADNATPFSVPVRVSLLLTPPDRRERDADGYLKAPIDFLVKAGLLPGDSLKHVRAVAAEWSDEPPAKPGRCVVSVDAFAPQGGE